MSAMPARVTERKEPAPATAASLPSQSPSESRSESRPDRRAEQKQAQRIQQRWALLACAILVVALGLTVGILDVLR